MVYSNVIKWLIFILLLSGGTAGAKDEALLFEIEIEHYGKGMIDHILPTTIETAYQPQMVGYWLSNVEAAPDGEPVVVLEVIFYGADFKAGRNVNTVVLRKREFGLVFFQSKETQPKQKNLPQYCFVQVMDINASKKYVKLRHWISRHRSPNR